VFFSGRAGIGAELRPQYEREEAGYHQRYQHCHNPEVTVARLEQEAAAKQDEQVAQRAPRGRRGTGHAGIKRQLLARQHAAAVVVGLAESIGQTGMPSTGISSKSAPA